MSRAKLILTGVALFAVAGGALAFKAQRGAVSFCRVSNQTGICTTTLNDISFSTTTPTQGVTTYCTSLPGAPCRATVSTLFQRQ
jgi:hypothetical protein